MPLIILRRRWRYHFRSVWASRQVGRELYGRVNLRAWDDLGWYYGNSFGELQCPIGRSQYFDDTKNLAGSPNNSVGGFHACKRCRIAGNTGNIALGYIPTSGPNDWCVNENPDPPTLPDPLACGAVKGARSFNGINYAADSASHPDVGIKIRAHATAGTITNSGTGTGGACGAGYAWVQNLSNLRNNAAPTNWKTELFTEYPWLEAICPDPTSLTGAPGGASPWSIGQVDLPRGRRHNGHPSELRASSSR